MDFNTFSIRIFKQQNKQNLEIRAPLAAPRRFPIRGVSGRPTARAARPPGAASSPGCQRKKCCEIKNIAEFFILQTMKSMKCSWHSFNNIRFQIKTLNKLLSRFAGDCCIAFPIPISMKKKNFRRKYLKPQP